MVEALIPHKTYGLPGFQCLSTEVTCESGAALAATLANGGLCPMSGDQVLSTSAVRSTLSIMQVAGMNDYSRIFHFKVIRMSLVF